MYYEDIKNIIETYCKEQGYTIHSFDIKPVQGTWHNGFTGFRLDYTQGKLYCSLTEMPSGCGVMLFHHFYNTSGNYKGMLPILQILFNAVGNVGTIIATLGDDWSQKWLTEWEFEPIANYANLAHAQPDYQTLYKKTIR